MAMKAELDDVRALRRTDGEIIRDLTDDVAALLERLRTLEADHDELTKALDEVETQARAHAADPPAAHEIAMAAGDRPPAGPSAGEDPQTEEPLTPPEPLDMRQLLAWVGNNLALVVERKIAQSQAPNWCPQWWLHSEAIARFEAVRRAWLEAVASPGAAMVVYFEHLDHELDVLMGPVGTFASCRNRVHTEAPLSKRVLGQDEPPEEYFQAYDAATADSCPHPVNDTSAPQSGGASGWPAAAQAGPATTSAGGARRRPTPYPRTGGHGLSAGSHANGPGH